MCESYTKIVLNMLSVTERIAKQLYMEYFWKQQDDIPYGMGYPLFGKVHLLSISTTFMLIILLLVIITRWDKHTQRKVQKAIPIGMLLLEGVKDLFLVSVGRFGIGYLPLHVCSIGIFVFLLREYLPWRWSRDYFGEVAYVLIMPASIAALLFADWTIYYPALNFMNLYSYIWHGLLVLYPVLLRRTGQITLDVRHMHWVLLFLCLVVPPVYIFDKIFGCNYFFVNWPVPGSPLQWLAGYMGNPGYLIGYAILTILVMLFVYLCVGIISKLFERRRE